MGWCPTRAPRVLIALALALAATAGRPVGAVGQEGDAAGPGGTMWQIFEALRTAFALSLDPDAYRNGANRPGSWAGWNSSRPLPTALRRTTCSETT
jgi:hypothetical protein